MKNESNRTRKENVFFRVSEEERNVIDEKMELAGISNMRSFMTKMAIDGRVIEVDLTDFSELASYYGGMPRNLNQMIDKLGEKNIYREDLIDLRDGYKELWGNIDKMYQALVNLK